MSLSAGPSDPPPARPTGRTVRDRARLRYAAARARYEGSWVADIVTQLQALHFADWTTIFGAELLWSALPFILLLSSLANTRIDDDLSRHLGLNARGAVIVETLFRHRPAHATIAILSGLVFSFAGSVAIVGSLQTLYERVFRQQHRRRTFHRLVIWVAVFLVAATLEAVVGKSIRSAAGPVVEDLVGFFVVTVLFGWTMHFLLAGRVRWRLVIRPALISGLLWTLLAIFSSIYFSSTVIDDSKTYGTVGVMFTFLTWFIFIGFVVVLGAAGGAVWQQRVSARAVGLSPETDWASPTGRNDSQASR